METTKSAIWREVLLHLRIDTPPRLRQFVLEQEARARALIFVRDGDVFLVGDAERPVRFQPTRCRPAIEVLHEAVSLPNRAVDVTWLVRTGEPADMRELFARQVGRAVDRLEVCSLELALALDRAIEIEAEAGCVFVTYNNMGPRIFTSV